MDNRWEQLFTQTRARQEKALIGYLTVGDPDLHGSYERCRIALRSGVDALELGIPYSDPLADGPVIQAAGQRALATGFHLDWLWQLLDWLRAEFPHVPLAVMSYVNPLLQYGPAAFLERQMAAGAQALILPDVPEEEAGDWEALCQARGVARIRFVAPTTPDARRHQILAAASGFVYCVSVTGVTGPRPAQEWAAQQGSVQTLLHAVHQEAPHLPACLGFGIARGGDIRHLANAADGVIVGSALIEAAQEDRLPQLVAELKEATLPAGAREG